MIASKAISSRRIVWLAIFAEVTELSARVDSLDLPVDALGAIDGMVHRNRARSPARRCRRARQIQRDVAHEVAELREIGAFLHLLPFSDHLRSPLPKAPNRRDRERLAPTFSAGTFFVDLTNQPSQSHPGFVKVKLHLPYNRDGATTGSRPAAPTSHAAVVLAPRPPRGAVRCRFFLRRPVDRRAAVRHLTAGERVLPQRAMPRFPHGPAFAVVARRSP